MRVKGNVLLLLTAMIWGSAFVAQRVGMEYIGPFAYTAVRFVLGALSLAPVMMYFGVQDPPVAPGARRDNALAAGVVLGCLLFCGVSLQQIGLIYTTAGKAAFITCLYIVLVPLGGLFLKQSVRSSTWLGSLLAVAGLYLLCVKEGFVIGKGDLFMFISTFFWTAHILMIDRFARSVNALKLSLLQFSICAALSGVCALALEDVSALALEQAAIPILYGGVLSVGVAYTLQVVGQKYAAPTHAAIILSMETVFAALAGYLFLNETLGLRELAGCALMMAGMLCAQLKGEKPAKPLKRGALMGEK